MSKLDVVSHHFQCCSVGTQNNTHPLRTTTTTTEQKKTMLARTRTTLTLRVVGGIVGVEHVHLTYALSLHARHARTQAGREALTLSSALQSRTGE